MDPYVVLEVFYFKEDKMEKEITMEELTNFCKNYGFIFQGSEIYGGLANTWDYGPLGSRLKNNIKDAWRKKFIQERSNAYELDADILMHPRVWEASGHVDSFADPLTDCKNCKTRHRADNLVNDYTHTSIGDTLSNEELIKYIKFHSKRDLMENKRVFYAGAKFMFQLFNEINIFDKKSNSDSSEN